MGRLIAIVSVIPVEAEASVQYMSSWPWAWRSSCMCTPPSVRAS
jgi:hypothetical protein